MPVVATYENSLLVARYQTGVSEGGSPIVRQKSISGIKETATDQQVYNAAQGLFSLVQYDLAQVRRDNRLLLTEEL